jgi:hypothetical protein
VKLDKNKIKPLVPVLKHLLTWVEPTWKFPERASGQLKDFQFPKEVLRFIYTEDTDLEVGRQFILDLLSVVSEETMWHDAAVEEEV